MPLVLHSVGKKLEVAVRSLYKHDFEEVRRHGHVADESKFQMVLAVLSLLPDEERAGPHMHLPTDFCDGSRIVCSSDGVCQRCTARAR